MMFTLLLAAALAAPGAEKVSTHWDMSPAEVVAAVSGAKTEKASDTTTINEMDRLASAQLAEGDIALEAGFYFTPGSPKLRLVDIEVTAPERCGDYRTALADRYGRGEIDRAVTKVGDTNVTRLNIRWSDPASGDDLRFIGIMYPSSEDMAFCKLMRTPKA